jgi:hypothetical protein
MSRIIKGIIIKISDPSNMKKTISHKRINNPFTHHNLGKGFFILFISLLVLSFFNGCNKKIILLQPAIPEQIGTKKPDKKLFRTVLILVDQKSESKLGEFPWPRSLLGKLLERLKTSKLIVIGFYLDRIQNHAEDSLLIRAVSLSKKVILPAKLYNKDLYAYESSVLYGRDLPNLFGFEPKFSSDRALLPYLAIADYVRNIGFTGFDSANETGEVFPLVVEFSGKVYPTLPLVVLKEYLKLTSRDFHLGGKKFFIGQNSLPVSFLNFHPNLYLDQKPPVFSYYDILEGNFQGDPFANKIVIISIDLKNQEKKAISDMHQSPGIRYAQWIESLMDQASIAD